MSSDEFYTRYLAGKLEDTRDFIEWAGYYQQYIELHREVIGVYTFDTGQVLT